jgi:hypothetical protein
VNHLTGKKWPIELEESGITGLVRPDTSKDFEAIFVPFKVPSEYGGKNNHYQTIWKEDNLWKAL